MQTNAGAKEVVAQLVPGGDAALAHLSDRELLASTRELVGSSNRIFAALLAHLAEVDARGLHRTRACASIYTYCIYELRFSEDAAARRAGAAKLVKQFPVLLPAIANGELHLTGLLMLGPHFTPENIVEVLGRAKFRTKRELAKLVRELHPLPLVPDLVEPLRPELHPLRKPTSAEYAASLAPAIRELPLGERPKDWANDANDDDFHEVSSLLEGRGNSSALESLGDGGASETEARAFVSAESSSTAPARVEPLWVEFPSTAPARVEPLCVELPSTAPARVEPLCVELPSTAPATPARVEPWTKLPPVTGPQQYQVQFSTTEEHVQLIERAKALLSRSAPGKSLGELHLEAMRLLVVSLEKQKFGMSARPRAAAQELAQGAAASATGDEVAAAPHSNGSEVAAAPHSNGSEVTAAPHSNGGERSRHIPADVRRAVYERDRARCTFIDGRGERCRETHCLELHHRQPFGKQGTHTAANLTLHCRTHNALAAELDFGREHMVQRQQPGRHESLTAERRAAKRVTGEPV